MELMELGIAMMGTAPALAFSWWALWSRRARRRNLEDACGRCGQPLYRDTRSGGAPHLVQGELVCDPCSGTLRRRTLVAFGVVGAIVVTGVVAGGAMLLGGQMEGLLLAGGVVAEYGLLFSGASWWMKRRNRRAERELTASAPDTAPRLVS